MLARQKRIVDGFYGGVLVQFLPGTRTAPGGLRRERDDPRGYRLDQVIFRPVPSLSPYRTPLDGLYLGSAATFPGGAVHGVPGDAAARAALADEAPLRRAISDARRRLLRR